MRAYISSMLVLLGASSLACGKWQNDARDFQEVKPPVVFQDGFFGLERSKESSWHWMGDELPRANGPTPLKGTVLLLNPKKDSVLTIAAIVPGMPAPPTIKFFFNGEPLDEFKLTRDRFEKSYMIPAATQGREEYCELLLSTDQFRIPSEINKASADCRRLGIRVTKLTWAASEGVPPIVAPPGPEAVPPIEERPIDSSSQGWLPALLLVAMMVFLPVLAFAVYRARRTRGIHEVEEVSEPAKAANRGGLLEFACAHCGKTLKARAELEGKKVKCPYCNQAVLAQRPPA